MSANASPIFSKVGDVQWPTTVIATANTAKDGTGTVLTVFTADATNGGFVRSISACPIGTNTASVLRVFVNNGSTNATAGNNSYFKDFSLPATTLTEVAGQTILDIPIGIALPPGFKLNCTIGTTVAAGWALTGVGGKY